MNHISNMAQKSSGNHGGQSFGPSKIRQMVASQRNFSKEKWIIGVAAGVEDNSRTYVIHTQFPRFIARLVAFTADGHYIDDEPPADLQSFPVCRVDDENILCEVTWLESIKVLTAANVRPESLLEKAAEAVREETRLCEENKKGNQQQDDN